MMTNYWPFRTYMDYLTEWEGKFGSMPKQLDMSSWGQPTGEKLSQHNVKVPVNEMLSALSLTRRYEFMLHQMLPMLNKENSSLRPPEMDAPLELKLETINTLYEYIWECEHRHTWQISPEALEFLESCSCECKTSEFLLPFDTLVLTFPIGFMLPKARLPLRSVLIGRIRSQMARDFALKLIQGINQPQPVTFYAFDFGEQPPGPNGKSVYTWDNSSPSIRSFVNVLDNESIEEFNMPTGHFLGGEYESDAVREAVILCSTLVWLAKAKPEFVKPEKIKCKPHVRHPKLVDRITIPPLYLNAVRKVRVGETAKRDDRDGPHWHVRPHMRGFSIRELRHERYHRNPDGSFKVILVEPYFVGEQSEADSEIQSNVREVRR